MMKNLLKDYFKSNLSEKKVEGIDYDTMVLLLKYQMGNISVRDVISHLKIDSSPEYLFILDDEKKKELKNEIERLGSLFDNFIEINSLAKEVI